MSGSFVLIAILILSDVTILLQILDVLGCTKTDVDLMVSFLDAAMR